MPTPETALEVQEVQPEPEAHSCPIHHRATRISASIIGALLLLLLALIFYILWSQSP